MASGKLGSAALVASTVTTVYTAPADKVSTVNISVCNRDTAGAKVRVAITSSAAPADADWIEYDAPVTQSDPLGRTGEVVGAGEKVFVYADTATCTARVSGFEETA